LERLARQLAWRAPATVEVGAREVRLHLGLAGRAEPLAEARVDLITVRVAPSTTPPRLLRIGRTCSPWSELVIESSSPDQLLTATVEGSVDAESVASSGFAADGGVLRLSAAAATLQRAVRLLRPASTRSAAGKAPGASVVELSLRLEAASGAIAGATSRAAITLVAGPTMSLEDGPLRIRSGETSHPFESLRINDDPRADDVELVTEGPLTSSAGESRPEWRFAGAASEVEAAARSLSHATRASARATSVVFAARLGTRASDPASRERRELRLDIARDPRLVAWRLAIAAVLLLGACATSWWGWTSFQRRSVTIPHEVTAWTGDPHPLRSLDPGLFENGRTVSIGGETLNGAETLKTREVYGDSIDLSVELPGGGGVVQGRVAIKRVSFPFTETVESPIVGRVGRDLTWPVFNGLHQPPELWLRLTLPNGVTHSSKGWTSSGQQDGKSLFDLAPQKSKEVSSISLQATGASKDGDGQLILQGYAEKPADGVTALFTKRVRLTAWQDATLNGATDAVHVWQGESSKPFKDVTISEDQNTGVGHGGEATPTDLRATVTWKSPNGKLISNSLPPEGKTANAASVQQSLQDWVASSDTPGEFTATLTLNSSVITKRIHVHAPSTLLAKSDDTPRIDLRDGDPVPFPVADSVELKNRKVKLSVTAPGWRVGDRTGWKTVSSDSFEQELDATTQALNEALKELRPPTVAPGSSVTTTASLTLTPVFDGNGTPPAASQDVEVRIHGMPKVMPIRTRAWSGDVVDIVIRDTMPGDPAATIRCSVVTSAGQGDSETTNETGIVRSPRLPGPHLVHATLISPASGKSVVLGLFPIEIVPKPRIIKTGALPPAKAGATILPFQHLEVIDLSGEQFKGRYEIKHGLTGNEFSVTKGDVLEGTAAEVTTALRKVEINGVEGDTIEAMVEVSCDPSWGDLMPLSLPPELIELKVVDSIEQAITFPTADNVKAALGGLTENDVQESKGLNGEGPLKRLMTAYQKALDGKSDSLVKLLESLDLVSEQPVVAGFIENGIWEAPIWDDDAVILKLRDNDTKFRFLPAPKQPPEADAAGDWYLAVDELGAKEFVELYNTLDPQSGQGVKFPKDSPTSAEANYSGVKFDSEGKPSLNRDRIWSRNGDKLIASQVKNPPVTGLTPNQWESFLTKIGCLKVPPQSSYDVQRDQPNPIIIDDDLPRGAKLPLNRKLAWIGGDESVEKVAKVSDDKKTRTEVSPNDNVKALRHLDGNVAELVKAPIRYAAIGPSWVSTRTTYDEIGLEDTAFYLGLRPAIQVRDHRWKTWEARRNEVLGAPSSPPPAR
jgi:hypothetical protein